MTSETITFRSGGATCVGEFHAAAGAVDGPRPAIAMAHGFGGTVDSRLVPFARAFAAAGWHFLAFDYRGFGASPGDSPPDVDPRG